MKIASIVGARPQFIKAAPVSRAIEDHNRRGGPKITEISVHTGQHYDYEMSQVFFDELEIKTPDYHLGVGSGSHGKMTAAMLEKIEEVLLRERPNWVLVYGDTNSTLAGALAPAKLHIPVAHVEAGLRSYNRDMPEEINRVLTDHLSSLLFCPTNTAVSNLEQEGITEGVFKVGDVMFDSFLFNKDLAWKKANIISKLGLEPKAYCLATVHRQENTDNEQNLAGIFQAFTRLASQDQPFVVPLHPRTAKVLNELGGNQPYGPHVRVLEPVSYLDMIALEIHAKMIFTDSGGVQKEAYFLRVPCVTLRSETEWVDTVTTGWNIITGPDKRKIMDAFTAVVARKGEGRPFKPRVTGHVPDNPAVLKANDQPFGDGTAAQRIVGILLKIAI